MKKTTCAILAGALALVSYATTVKAADVSINIHGASAQKTYWSSVAKNFLDRTVTGSLGGCDSNPVELTSGDHYIVVGSNCTSVNNGKITIRVSAKNSLDGIMAAKGEGSLTIGSLTCSGKNRPMLVSNSGSTLGCYPVTLGASDVAGETFGQASHGKYLGPLGGADTNAYAEAQDTSTLTPHKPVVVPFGFFVNNAVKMSKCVGGTKDGEMCTAGSTTECGTGTCTVGNLENVSRMMVTQIFSGKSWYWTDFGAGFTSGVPIVACMRHAGSGTHATLDYGVMRGNGWGYDLATYESASEPTVWFNNGSGDLMNCVNTVSGAIGYADADQANKTNTYGPIKYNGYKPTRVNIRNGLYDNFWSAQHLYENQTDTLYSATHPVVLNLMTFASNPSTVPSTKALYWATQDEMVYMKADDKSYPAYQGAITSQTP
jgi:hypothetical protein